MKKPQVLVSALLLALLLVACVPKAAPVPAPQAPTSASAAAPAPAAPRPLAKAPSKEAWEVEWDSTVQAAKKEGKVLVYATTGEYRSAWAAAVESYGVMMDVVVGQGPEISQKILTERRVGMYISDFFMSAPPTGLTLLKPKGAFDPMDAALILPEVKDPKVWYGERLPFVDNQHTLFAYLLFFQPALRINTDLVKAGEIKSYKDLLDPKWREKIGIMNPSKSGSGGAAVCVISEIMGWDYLRQLATQAKPIILTDDRIMLDWLAHGKLAVTLSAQSAEYARFRSVGAPIGALSPEEGSWVTGGIGSAALLNKAAHPNAAKVFLNQLLSREGQTAVSKAGGFPSARLDVPTDFLDPSFIVNPSKTHFLYDREEFILSMPDKYKIAADVFMPK